MRIKTALLGAEVAWSASDQHASAAFLQARLFHGFRWTLLITSWLLLVVVAAQWLLIRWLGDRWWVGTVLMFAPRWPLLVPLAIVAAGCLVWWRKLLCVNAVSALLVAGPVMGLCLPVSIHSSVSDGFGIRLLTANTGGGAHPDSLRAEIKQADPDVIAFQEFSAKQVGDLIDPKWQWRTARGLAVASRFPILESSVCDGAQLGRHHDFGLRVRIHTPGGDAWVCCVYLNSPRRGFESLMVTRHGISGEGNIRDNTRERGEQSQLVSRWVAEVRGPAIVAGDMNLPAESYFYRRDWLPRQDAYSNVRFGYGHTWFSRWHGIRIDHILVDDHWQVAACYIAGFTGGDHRPLVADLSLKK